MTDEPGRPHYWSMEHYGFPDQAPAAAGTSQHRPAPARSATGPGRRLRRGLVALTAAAAMLVAGGGAFAAARAQQGPAPVASVQGIVDDAGVPVADGPRGARGPRDGRGAGPGPARGAR